MNRRYTALRQFDPEPVVVSAAQTETAPYQAPEKDLYELGEMPPMGHVPKQMYA